MTELERLKNRLFGDPTKKVTNFNVFWGPEAHKLTAEERAAEINKALDAPMTLIEDLDGDLPTTRWDAPFSTEAPRSKQPTVDVREWLAAREAEKKMTGGEEN